MIRVALVDDQALVRTGFAMLIGSQPDMEVVWQASDGDEVPGQPPVDVVLMDVQMARVNGITATRELLAGDENVKVVVLTTFDDADFVRGAVDAGASGFLLKDAEPEQLLDSIRTVYSGNAVLAPKVTKGILQSLRAGGDTAEAADADLLAVLTDREQEILRLIALGYTNDEIAEAEFVSMATVKTHVRHIFDKTGSRDRVQAVLYAFRARLVTPAELLQSSPGMTS